MKALELKIPPALLVVLFGMLMFAASLMLPKFYIAYYVKFTLTAFVLVVASYFLIFGVVEFRRRKTTVDPRFPEKVTSLVDSGVYSISRNPMYVGFALLLVAMIFVLESPFLVFGVVAFVYYMNRFQIEPEERVLAEIFGDMYLKYKSRVRRWV